MGKSGQFANLQLTQNVLNYSHDKTIKHITEDTEMKEFYDALLVAMIIGFVGGAAILFFIDHIKTVARKKYKGKRYRK